jgi:hypothetical protein
MPTGLFTCIWNGEEWRVIITESKIPELHTPEMDTLIEKLTLAVEDALSLKEPSPSYYRVQCPECYRHFVAQEGDVTCPHCETFFFYNGPLVTTIGKVERKG